MVLFENGMPRNVDNLESMILWMVPPQLSVGYNLLIDNDISNISLCYWTLVHQLS